MFKISLPAWWLIWLVFLCPGSSGAQNSVTTSGPAIDVERVGPELHVEPPRLDFGSAPAGEKLSRRIEITNIGKNTLKWRGFAAKVQETILSGGRYVSLLNEESRNTGVYRIPPAYHGALDLAGQWQEKDGYPVCNVRSTLKFHFSGTGICLYFWQEPAPGKFSVYIDEKFAGEIDVLASEKRRAESHTTENLPAGRHTVTIVGKEGRAVLEGFEVYGQTGGMKVPTGWITLIPSSGVTTREIDYVTVVLNLQKTIPGPYSGAVVVSSNGGNAHIPVSITVTNENLPKVVDIYRYSSGNDFLFTASPHLTDPLIATKTYRKEGIAFRLFSPGTPGTVDFYRWYSAARGSHFYSINRDGASKPDRNYVLEGSIGYIATIRLRHTKPLYRWFHPQTRFYFYSTDLRGENIETKGYRFDGIAGYVQ